MMMVLLFQVLYAKEAPTDLVEFIESGYDWILDANQVPTDEKGKVTVFQNLIQKNARKIMELLSEVNPLVKTYLDIQLLQKRISLRSKRRKAIIQKSQRNTEITNARART